MAKLEQTSRRSPENIGARIRLFPDGSRTWSVGLDRVGTTTLGSRLEEQLPGLVCGPLLVHYLPYSTRSRLMAVLELLPMFPQRVGLLSRDAVKPSAVLGLSAGVAIQGESVAGLGLWVDTQARRKRVGTTLLSNAGEFIETAIETLRVVYPNELQAQDLRFLDVYVTSDPDSEMTPKFNPREWYGKLYHILKPQGFEVNRQVWSQDPQDGGPMIPSLMRRFTIAPIGESNKSRE